MGQPLSVKKEQGVKAMITAGRGRVEVEITLGGIDESRAGSLDRCGKGIRNRCGRLHPIVRAADTRAERPDDSVAAGKDIVASDYFGAARVGAEKLNPTVSGHKGVVKSKENPVVIASGVLSKLDKRPEL